MVIVVGCKIDSLSLTSWRLIYTFIFKFCEQGIFIGIVPIVLSSIGLRCSHHSFIFRYLHRVCSIGELHLSCHISRGPAKRISIKVAIRHNCLRTQKLTDVSTSLQSCSHSLLILTADTTRTYLIGDVRIHTQLWKQFEQFLLLSSFQLKLFGLVFIVANMDIVDIPHEMISGSRWLCCLISSLTHLIKNFA